MELKIYKFFDRFFFFFSGELSGELFSGLSANYFKKFAENNGLFLTCFLQYIEKQLKAENLQQIFCRAITYRRE